jgi:hypothetical protein
MPIELPLLPDPDEPCMLFCPCPPLRLLRQLVKSSLNLR